jgi:flagellar motility protein MotE (MotC chaperone)
MNMNLMPDQDELELLKLKNGMTEQQRSDMAEIIQNELKRREGLSKKSAKSALISSKSKIPASRMSTNLTHEDLNDIYSSTDKNIQHLRVQSLEKRLQEAKREVMKLGGVGRKKKVRDQSKEIYGGTIFSSFSNKAPAIVIVLLLISLGTLRYSKDIYSASELFGGKGASQVNSRAAMGTPASGEFLTSSSFIGDQAVDSDNGEDRHEINNAVSRVSSPIERGILMQLDQRRVELEKRRKILDAKEQELQHQAQLIGEKVAELKTLINKLSALRKEKDHKYNARMEQLASVYSAMAPHESANLIAKLDDEVSLALLERMPGKRMAQILGVMDQNRAIELTKHLTNKKKL